MAFARIDGGRVRLLGSLGVPRDGDDWGSLEDLSSLGVALRSRPLGEVVRERLDDAREQWAITTFFLFDPNSWR